MPNESKVYVINPRKTSDPRRIVERTVKAAPETNGSSRPRKDSGTAGGVRTGSLGYTFLSYILGPLAIFSTREGRSSKLWSIVAAVSVALVLTLLLGWGKLLSTFGEKGFVILPMMLVASAALLLLFTAWSRALYLNGRCRPLLARNLPDPLRKPALVGLLGFLFPGMGLLVTGHHRRAALTMWLTGFLAVSLFVLSRASWLWSWNRGAGSEALEGTTLERLFMLAGGVALFGAIVWIVQALDGARLAERRFIKETHPSGGAAAFALITVLALFGFVFEPASVAETLDNLALSAQDDGFMLLPLHAELAAMRLDPSKPLFTIEAAELYDMLGEHENAEALRGELMDRFRHCIGLMRKQGMLEPYVDQGGREIKEARAAPPVEIPVTPYEEQARDQAPAGPWERIRSEYGLFQLSLGGYAPARY